MKKRLLLAEDDADFAGVLKHYLSLQGFEVTHAGNGAVAKELLAGQTFDICILDVMMPKVDGFALATEIRKEYGSLPFVFLTARELKQDRINGLKLGADDYIVKPFEADELVLRLQNILRRSDAQRHADLDEPIAIGSYRFDPVRHELRKGTDVRKLTSREVRLLQYLNQHRNRVLKRDEVLSAVWGTDDFFAGRSMDVFISKLRKYLADDPGIKIESARNIGLEFKVHS